MSSRRDPDDWHERCSRVADMHSNTHPLITTSTNLATLWPALLDRQLFVVDSYCAGGRCYAVIERARGEHQPRQFGVHILERVFRGESQKALAHELEVSIATVAAHSAGALRAIGKPQQVSRASIILVMAALAAQGVPLQAARLEDVREDGRWIISVEVPGASLRRRLSACEWEVCRLSIQGETHVGIAAARGTSRRTVANQLASAFHKLGISGRGALRAQAIHEAAFAWRASPEPTTPAPVVALTIPAAPEATWREQRKAAYG
jgi:DNA-binding NarL/FixJ family response regulator